MFRLIRQLSHQSRVGIVTGIVSSLIVIYFIDPLLSEFGRLFLSTANVVFSSYLDRMYSEIAVSAPDIGALIIFGAGGCALGYLLVAPFLPSIARRGYRRGYQQAKRERETGQLADRTIVDRSLLAGVAVLASIVLGFAVDFHIRIKTTSSFEQYVTILAPRIGDRRTRELRAQFASMRSADDYAEVLAALRSLAEEHSLELPANRLYPLPSPSTPP